MDAVLSPVATRFLTFKVASQLYALRTEDVSEVIRVPLLARVPQAPAALRGVANLRGSILAVAGLRELLGLEPAGDSPTTRAIVLDIGEPVALIVDSVASMESPTAERIETRPNELGADGAEKLLGAFQVGPQQVAKVLDIKTLLEVAFATRGRGQKQGRHATTARVEQAVRRMDRSEMLVTFEIAGQEFGLALDVVREILSVPAEITAVARTDAAVMGISSVRGQLLPLLSLRALLGIAQQPADDSTQQIVVIKIGESQVGLVADRARAIVAADPDFVDPVPAVLAARTGGESRLRSVYRAEGGRRLISILSPELLFKEDVMKRLAASAIPRNVADAPTANTASEQRIFLVFRLADDEFGLPIDSVVEVAPVPKQITRVPRTPKFLEGVVNLRGEVLPVVDQRRRFDLPTLEGSPGRRLVVIKTERHRAGIIVDSVSDVLRTSSDRIEPAPELTESTSRLVRGVVNLQASNRIVLLLDPTELLTRAEQGLLDTFHAKRSKDGA